MPKWQSGPPPSVGWWPTQDGFGPRLRWWNGKCWSVAVVQRTTSERAGQFAGMETATPIQFIKWSVRPKSWPEHSHT
jgi:hypothetical protein